MPEVEARRRCRRYIRRHITHRLAMPLHAIAADDKLLTCRRYYASLMLTLMLRYALRCWRDFRCSMLPRFSYKSMARHLPSPTHALRLMPLFIFAAAATPCFHRCHSVAALYATPADADDMLMPMLMIHVYYATSFSFSPYDDLYDFLHYAFRHALFLLPLFRRHFLHDAATLPHADVYTCARHAMPLFIVVSMMPAAMLAAAIR